MLKVQAKKLDAVEILSLQGKLVNGDTETLRTAVQSAASDAGDVILDLSNVSVMDAHGVGVLLELREQALANGSHFKLRNVNERLSRVFQITRLNTIFEIDSDVEYLPEPAYVLRLLAAA